MVVCVFDVLPARTTTGNAILAFTPVAENKEIIEHKGLRKFTANPMVGPVQLIKKDPAHLVSELAGGEVACAVEQFYAGPIDITFGRR